MDYPPFYKCVAQNPDWAILLKNLHHQGIINGQIPREAHEPANDPADQDRYEGAIRWTDVSELLCRYFGGHIRRRREQLGLGIKEIAALRSWWKTKSSDFSPISPAKYSRGERGEKGGHRFQPTDLIQISDRFDEERAEKGGEPVRRSLFAEFASFVHTLLGKTSSHGVPVPTEDIDCLCRAIKAALDAHKALAESVSPAGGDLDELHEHLFRVIEKKLAASHVFGQERSFDESTPGGLVWIVDALDGERMFRRRFPNWCICLAAGQWHPAIRRFDPVCGVVYNPPRDDLFVGLAKGGALLIRPHRCTLARLAASHTCDPGEAMIATHLSTNTRNARATDAFLLHTLAPLTRWGRVVMLGCGQLALCYVAAGRVDGFLNVATNLWNVCAGQIILQAARNIHPGIPLVTDFAGKNWTHTSQSVLAACNKTIQKSLLEIARQI